MELDGKRDELHGILRDCGPVMVAYSGGVDSVFLAAEAVDVLGKERVLAVTGLSPSVAGRQYRMAERVARRFDIPWRTLRTFEMEDEDYASNPTDRCYFCKAELYGRLTRLAAEDGRTVVDGANADDASDYRPGQRAARERGVRSPLMEAEIRKEEVRALSRRRGLPTWDAPASPCLASRLPYGVRVTRERLRQVEAGEEVLRELGVEGDLRVRHHEALARIELPPVELGEWLRDPGRQERLARRFREIGFDRVALDLEGYRSGSLNLVVADDASPDGGSDGSDGKARPSPDGRSTEEAPATWSSNGDGEAAHGVGGASRGHGVEGEVAGGVRRAAVAGDTRLSPGGPRGEVALLRMPRGALERLATEECREAVVRTARSADFRFAAVELTASDLSTREEVRHPCSEV